VTDPIRVDDFDFTFPPQAVAQRPLADRSASRLLVLSRRSGAVEHRRFRDVPELLAPGDVLVLNASRVIPARLFGRRDSGRPAEILLVQEEPSGTWLAMVHPGGKLKAGRHLTFEDGWTGEIVDVLGGGLRRIRFDGPHPVRVLLERHGTVPLPPYIARSPDAADRERYQTVYATSDGSVAAPTAGLHFTPELLARVTERGIRIAELLLHVGPGTFKPVDVDDPARHRMHAERYEVPDVAATVINEARSAGGRVWAVGTTAARTLETVVRPDGSVAAGVGWTDLFIYPPYRFGAVDALLTNFHLPRSTLIMLVAAFAGHGATMAAYRTAIEQGYRLFSYGDAMAIVP
jgi:S-adenosylmethionine:tRNA ribosyltransferase-isomerase